MLTECRLCVMIAVALSKPGVPLLKICLACQCCQDCGWMHDLFNSNQEVRYWHIEEQDRAVGLSEQYVRERR